MEVTLEQVERVRQYAKVSCGEAKAALEEAGGVPLDAVILLEQQGKAVAMPGGSWSTKFGGPPEEAPTAVQTGAPAVRRGPKHRKYTSKEVGDVVKGFLRNCTKISVDIWRGDDLLVGVPLIICVLLFIVAYQIMIPLTILGLILHCRYHISGWDWNTEAINRTMDQVSGAVADLTDRVKRECKEEWSEYHRRKKSS